MPAAFKAVGLETNKQLKQTILKQNNETGQQRYQMQHKSHWSRE